MLVRSVAGFGDAIVALPLLSIFLGLTDSVALVTLTGFASALAIGLSSWSNINWRAIGPYLLASVIGVPLGIGMLRNLPERWLLGGLGLLVCLFGVYKLRTLQMSLSKPASMADSQWGSSWLTYGLGVFGGMIGSAYGILGPPVVVYGMLRGWTPAMFRATLQGYFGLTTSLIVLGHGLTGLWNQQVMMLFVMALPLIALAAYTGKHISTRLPAHHFERGVCIGIVVLGIMLML